MNDFDQQLFNLKNTLPSSKQSKRSIMCLLLTLPISFTIGEICLRSNLFILILELIAWSVNNRAKATRSRDKAVNLIMLSVMLTFAEIATMFGVLVKYLIGSMF